MRLDIDLLSERLKQPLPGATAHEPLRAVSIGAIKPRFEHKLPPRPGSVLILLYKDGDRIHFPLTIRPDYLGTHGGQISFPGGKAEEGEDAIETALREGEEEIGIRRSDIKIIGMLSDFFVIPSNFLVTPVVAFSETKPLFTPDPIEVVRIIEGSLADLVKEDAILTKEIIAAKTYQLMAPHFEIEGEIVWGATAMML
ncbi:MAG: CoA pyrophosphatase, partial [Bacteroidia bacterium]|nr:CoA pyrophosphatase [Bacteroidia bacterium]